MKDELERRYRNGAAHEMPVLITDECESYFVEEINAKVEDERGCMSIVSFELMGLEGMSLRKKIFLINKH